MSISGSNKLGNVNLDNKIEIKPQEQKKETSNLENSKKLFENKKSTNNLITNDNDLDELENLEINNSKINNILDKIESKSNELHKINSSIKIKSQDLSYKNLSLEEFLNISDESLKQLSKEDQKKIFENAKSEDFRNKSNELVKNFLKQNNFSRHDIGDDGNCFFYSIEKGLKKLSNPENIDYKTLRKNACDYIEKNPNQFLGLDLENDYLKNMRKDKTYANNEVIRAMSKLLDRPIVLVNTIYNEKSSEVNLQTSVYNHKSNKEPIFILRKNENHFELLTHDNKNSNEYKNLLENISKSSQNDVLYEELLPNLENVNNIQSNGNVIENDLTEVNKFVEELKNKEPREQLDKITKKISSSKSEPEIKFLNEKRNELIYKYFSQFQTGISEDNIKNLIKTFKEVTAHKGMFKTDRLVKPIYKALEDLEKSMSNNNDKINALFNVNKEINEFIKSHGKESTRTEWVKVLQNTINFEISNLSDDLFKKNIDSIKNIKKGDKISVKDNNFILQKSSIGQGITRSKNKDKREDLKEPLKKLFNDLSNRLSSNRITIKEYLDVCKGLENLSKTYDNKFQPLNKITNDFKNNPVLIEKIENDLENNLKINSSDFNIYKKEYENIKKYLSTNNIKINKIDDLELLNPEKIKYLPKFNGLKIENSSISIKNEINYDTNYNKKIEREIRNYINQKEHSDFKKDNNNTCQIFQKDFTRGNEYNFIKKDKIESIKSMDTLNRTFENDPELIYLVSRLSNQAFFGTISNLVMTDPEISYIKSIDNLNIIPPHCKTTYNFSKVDDNTFYINMNLIKNNKDFITLNDNGNVKLITDLDLNIQQNIDIKIYRKNDNWDFEIEKNNIKYDFSGFNLNNI